MIEENIIEWLELGDSIQKIDLVNQQKALYIFKANYLLLQYSHFPQIFYILIISIFFIQIWEINILYVDVEEDGLLEILKYLQNVFLLRDLITSVKIFLILFIFSLGLFILTYLLAFINVSLLNKKKQNSFLISLHCLLNILNIYYFNGPCLEIGFSINLCFEDSQIVLCSFKSISVIITLIISIIYSLVFMLGIILSSIHINDMGTINGSNVKSKINNNFTLVIVIIKQILFIFHFLLKFLIKNKNNWVLLIYQITFILFGIIISIYSYKELFYYNYLINYCFHFGCYYTTWFSICIFLKTLIKIHDITLFVIFGIIIITIGFYFNEKFKLFKLITEFNIFEVNSLKDIEIYNSTLLNLLRKNDHKSKILISGVIKRFEDYISNNEEFNEPYKKLLNDKHLQKKFTSHNELKILSIIAIIYSSNIEKLKDVTDITLNMCYFLINKFKNPVYAIWLCTRLKVSTYIQSYYKYVLMEQIKDYLIGILNKKMNKLTIKHVQISSVILYNQYVDLFKIKIYDATCSQIEYFDIFKNNITNSKTTENFLKIGEDILSIRKDILNLWEKIILLNPFSNESENDYMIYLETILQDDILMKTEEKRYNTLKAEKLSERNNAYYSLFIQELNAVLLVNGYSYNGKIIYTTPNFPLLFMFTGKEIINASIDDLLPEVIQNFHRYLIEDAIKYSNLGYIFKKQRDVLLKGKGGVIFNVYLYVKPVPNLSYGLIYFSNLHKIQEQNFIFILNDNLQINGFTGMNQMGNFTINNNYGLSYNINGHHIGTVIPEILLQMNYDMKTNTFFLSKNNIDLKGNLYPSNNIKSLDDKITKVLDALKYKKNNELNNENKISSFEEYDDLISEFNSQQTKPYSIFFRIEAHNFIGGKYKYYRIYIINDLLSGNENTLSFHSNINNNLNDEGTFISNENYNNNKVKLKDLHESNNMTILGNQLVKKNSNNKIIRLKTEMNKKNDNILINETNIAHKQTNLKEINLIEEDNTHNKQNLIYSSTNNNKTRENNFSQPSNPSSILTQSSAESAEFNKLKNEIINKNDSFYVKIMKYMTLFFFIINVVLIIYDYYYIKNIINSMVEYLKENLFFIHTKICTACIYDSAFTLKLIKEKVIKDNNCDIIKCHLVYSDALKNCIKEARNQKYNISYFYSDFQNIFNQKLQADLSIYLKGNKDYLQLDIDNFINLLISLGMKVLDNISDYFNENIEELKKGFIDVYLSNLITNSLKFFHSNYTGFSGKEKELLCNKVSNNPPLRVLLSFIIVLILMSGFFYYIIKINSIEIYFLDRLINFSSTSFDEYLKKLEELKKKFRDDTNEEEDKNIDDLDLKGDDIDEKNESKKNNKKQDANDNNKNTKKKKNKQNKIQQQKLKKKNIMSKYFYKLNILFALRIGFILIISTVYFYCTVIITSNMRNNYKEFDAVVEQINNAYLQSFDVFLTLKEQIEHYFYDNNSDINAPYDVVHQIPKIGNYLMYITRRNVYSEEGLNLLNNLYNNNACPIISNNMTILACQNIFSSILTKGMEQSIIQMSVILTSCVDEINSLKRGNNLTYLYNSDNDYANYEVFVGEFMLKSFLKTQDIFEIFRNDEKANIFKINKIILVIFCVINLFLLICMFYFIYVYKNVINLFFNFIGIMPAKYITDDEYLYKTIIKLEQNFY